jgi:hypothetical protein
MNTSAECGSVHHSSLSSELRSKRRQSADVVISPDSNLPFVGEKRSCQFQASPQSPSESHGIVSLFPNFEVSAARDGLLLQLEAERPQMEASEKSDHCSIEEELTVPPPFKVIIKTKLLYIYFTTTTSKLFVFVPIVFETCIFCVTTGGPTRMETVCLRFSYRL